jgi:hypothetical protein
VDELLPIHHAASPSGCFDYVLSVRKTLTDYAVPMLDAPAPAAGDEGDGATRHLFRFPTLTSVIILGYR